MTYRDKIEEILKDNLRENTFKFWKLLDSKIPDIWDKPTSSTGKYHQKSNGKVPSMSEHVYEMLYVCEKILPMWPFEKNSEECDILFLSIALHDAFKYGIKGINPHTDKKHDNLAAEAFLKNSDKFERVLDTKHFNILIESIRFHQGKWSHESSKDFMTSDMHDFTKYLHILDMLSTKDLIKTPELQEKIEEIPEFIQSEEVPF